MLPLLLLFVFLGVVIGLSSIWRGFVFSVLWGWFVVPIFHLPALGIATAIGLALVITFLTHQLNSSYGDDDYSASEKMTSSLTSSFIYPLIYLIIGYIVMLFM